jgi:uncharacterized protein YbbC (DUF1343 family)
MLHVTDRQRFLPLRTALAVVRTCRALGGSRFSWRKDAYEFVQDIPAFDLLCGTDQVRLQLDAGAPVDSMVQGFDREAKQFAARRAPHLLY